MSENKKTTKDDRLWAAMSYLWVLSVIVLTLKKNNEYVRFHANQGLFLFVISLAGFIPLLGQLVCLLATVLALVGMVKAYKGYKWPLPMFDGISKELGDWLVKTIKL